MKLPLLSSTLYGRRKPQNPAVLVLTYAGLCTKGFKSFLTFLYCLCFFNRTLQMAITASIPSKRTTHPPCQEIRPPRLGTQAALVPWASSEYQQACLSPTSTPHWERAPTACTTTVNASCWGWAAAPSSCVSESSSAARSATPALLSTHSATAASAATVSQTATCSSTKTARHQPPLHPTILSPPRKTLTSLVPSRSACRPMSDLLGKEGVVRESEAAWIVRL